jgi:uncharacterized membrane protein
MNAPWHLYVMALLYILAGVNHFRSPRMYEKIIPPYFPNPQLLNLLSGVLEILFGLGLLLIPTRSIAAWSIIILLFAFFPTHIYMITQPKVRMGLPLWALYLRLPLQLLLVFWSFQYTL